MSLVSGENTRVIDVRNLWKVFGAGSPDDAIARAQAGESRADILSSSGQTVAVRDVSFHVGSGETFVVMGLSGSGKSTLIRCLSRLIEPTRGEVRLNGTDLLAMGDDDLRTVRRGQMSMVFQHFGLFPHRKVIDNIAYGLEVQGVDKETRRARATEVLGIVGLDGWANHFPQQLSGGMQQRVGLARALNNDTSILLMDEAYSALDPLIRTDMQTMLLDLQTELGKTVVFITHDLDEALRLGDGIVILRDGSIVQQGTSQDILLRPADDYIERFVKDVNRGRYIKLGGVATALSGPEDSAAPRLSADITLEAAVKELSHAGKAEAVVTDAAGKAVGLATLQSIMEAL